ncbi:MAG: DNA polymerase III subunit gamma/tau [Pseudomonadota bacterium]
MSYQVLARKYRPKNFDTLVGQEHVVRALTHALQSGRLHHAYLFTGTRGVGKTTLSRILAKSLNCIGADGSGGITAQPCGSCEACGAIDAGRFVDYIEMDAASNRGVDEMAQLLEQAVYAPSNARFKVYMIDEVHMLTNHAFNAMLKTLEEPPEHVKFILATTDPQKIPVTVLSRCLQFNLKQMPPGHIINHLDHILGREGISFEQPALRLLAQGAHGSMRDALSLTDQAIAYAAGAVTLDAVQGMLGALDQTFLVRLLDALARQDGADLLAVADEMAARSLSYNGALQDLGTLLHRIALAQTVPAALPADLPEHADIVRLAAAFDREEVQLFYQIAVHGRNELGLAPDEYAGFSMTLLRMLAFRPGKGGADGTPGPSASAAGAGRAGAARAAPAAAPAKVAAHGAPSAVAAHAAGHVTAPAGAIANGPAARLAPSATAAAPTSDKPDPVAASAWPSAPPAAPSAMPSRSPQAAPDPLPAGAAASAGAPSAVPAPSARSRSHAVAHANVSAPTPAAALHADAAPASAWADTPPEHPAKPANTATTATHAPASQAAQPDAPMLADASPAPASAGADAPVEHRAQPGNTTTATSGPASQAAKPVAPVLAEAPPAPASAWADTPAAHAATAAMAMPAPLPRAAPAPHVMPEPAAADRTAAPGGAHQSARDAALQAARSGLKASSGGRPAPPPVARAPQPALPVAAPRSAPPAAASPVAAVAAATAAKPRAPAPWEDAAPAAPRAVAPAPSELSPQRAAPASSEDDLPPWVTEFSDDTASVLAQDMPPSDASGAGPESTPISAAAPAPAPVPAARPIAPPRAYVMVPVPGLDWDGNWPAVAAALPLRGVAQQLAVQAELIECVHQDHVTLFRVRVPIDTWRSSANVDKLAAALSERFGRKVSVETELGPVWHTASAAAQAQREATQRQAEQTIDSDPFVRSMMREFGAVIVPGSIMPAAALH